MLSKAIVLALAGTGVAQSQAQEAESGVSPDIVEMITVGRMRTAADDVMIERQESENVADFIDTTTISRVGDSNVAAALRRVPGVTLIDDKFVFVRGLGERYSTSLLNGAQIPSPDLTRNVIPLDIFPTNILRSVAVQKGYSASFPASFSGGMIDIRTLSIPDSFLFQVEAGSSFNTETDGDVLTYHGGGKDWRGEDDGTRAMSPVLRNALNEYQGDLDTISILNGLNSNGGGYTIDDAQQVNRELALALNRDIDVEEKGRKQNGSLQASLGNNFYLDNGMELGFVAGGAYQTSWQNRNSLSTDYSRPDDIFRDRQRSTHNVNVTGNLSLGWRWLDDHSIETTSLFLRNTDDEASIENYYDTNNLYQHGRGFRDYSIRYEQRELVVNQIRGSHRFGGITRDLLGGFEALPWLDDLTFEWFYSDATSTTDIPNEATVTYQTLVDPASGELRSFNLHPGVRIGDFRFTDLDDTVENYGWDLSLPLYLANTDIVFSGGYNFANKGRQYEQIQFGLGTTNAGVARGLDGLPSSVYDDAVLLDPDNNFAVDAIDSNGESYLAAINNTAYYGEVDVTWNQTWRVVAGVRWEDYSQVGLPWDPLDYEGCQISCDPDEILNSVFKENDYYPSLALTYMRDNFWAEQFQLRFGYSETLVRPDLREITPTSYIDPITDARVRGNANVVPSSVKNYDLRGDWYFSNGDTFSASLFYKDILDPIDLFATAAFEESLATEIINGESAEVYGVEFEWLKDLSFMGSWAEPFFIAGNLTALDSELTVGNRADAPTNPTRPLSGASDYSFNLQLGYDSMDGKHSAMLIYNGFSERLYFAGRNSAPDAYEQPFHSLDLTYFFYPTDHLTLRLRAKNLLEDDVTIEQDGAPTFKEEIGRSFMLDIRYTY